MSEPSAESSREPILPKLSGADIEFGNFIQGKEPDWNRWGTGGEAARALLREIDGFPRGAPSYGAGPWGAPAAGPQGISSYSPYSYSPGANPQDWGRKFLADNGGCVYIDLDHLEICLPEVLGAHDHVACTRAMLELARDAQVRANSRLPEGHRLQVLFNNSDGLGHSYGSHLNFLISRRAFDNIFHRKPHYMHFLASYLASSVLLGAGKVGSENGRPHVDYQLSQRADFFETLVGPQTTYQRPLVNSRDESLCGSARGGGGDATSLARLHLIFFDSTLCQVASLLKVGVTQILLARLEQGRIVPDLLLEDPLEALQAWSHDPTLKARASLVNGSRYTAAEFQSALLEPLRDFVAQGGVEGVVPRAREVLDLWESTLKGLRESDLQTLAPRLDWALKLCLLQGVVARHNLPWSSPEIKALDHRYSSLDPQEGLYWAYERAGVVERVVEDREIDRFRTEPPEDTRAWLRAQVLRRCGSVESVDWDGIGFRVQTRSYPWPSYSYHTLEMHDPLGFTRRQCEGRLAEAASFWEAVAPLCRPTSASWGRVPSSGSWREASEPRARGGGNGPLYRRLCHHRNGSSPPTGSALPAAQKAERPGQGVGPADPEN